MTDYKKEFKNHFDGLCRRRDRHTAWSDFLQCAAIALRQSIGFDQDRENQYLNIMKGYLHSEEEKFAFSRLLTCIVNGLEQNPFSDFLGDLFGVLELGNSYLGQFFTPYHLSKTIAALTLTDVQLGDRILSINEPACGSGGMIIAICDEAQAKGWDWQNQICFHATDVDARCFYMSYIQLSLIGVSALITLGNTLTLEHRLTWPTPMYGLSGMAIRERARFRSVPEEPIEAIPGNKKVTPLELTITEPVQLNLFGEVA